MCKGRLAPHDFDRRRPNNLKDDDDDDDADDTDDNVDEEFIDNDDNVGFGGGVDDLDRLRLMTCWTACLVPPPVNTCVLRSSCWSSRKRSSSLMVATSFSWSLSRWVFSVVAWPSFSPSLLLLLLHSEGSARQMDRSTLAFGKESIVEAEFVIWLLFRSNGINVDRADDW